MRTQQLARARALQSRSLVKEGSCMLTSPRANWARTRLTPFCLTWGERAAAMQAAFQELPDDAATSPHIKVDHEDERPTVRRTAHVD
jgi:hypothetical protein